MTFSNIKIMQRIKSIILYLLIIQTSILSSQDIGYEINIENDSMYYQPWSFVRNFNNGFVGIVTEASLTDSVNQLFSRIYNIAVNGDTTSTVFRKTDTLFLYNEIIRVNEVTPGFLLTGSGYEKNEDPYYKFTIFTRIDTNFNIIWEKIYKFHIMHYLETSAAMRLFNGDFLYVGSPNGGLETIIFKLSSNGDSIMSNHFEGDYAGKVVGLTYNSDSLGYLWHTHGAHYSGSTSTCSVVELDEELNQVTFDFYPDWIEYPYSSKLFIDGNIISAGTWHKTYPQYTDIKYIAGYKLNSNMDVVDYVYLTDPDSISRVADDVGIDYYYPSCIYIGGNFNLVGASSSIPCWYYITKLNKDFEVQYEKYIGGDAVYWLLSVTASADGGVLLAGQKSELGTPSYAQNGYLIKLDSTGCLTGEGASNVKVKDLLIYPNPGYECINIRTALDQCIFRLYDLSGICIIENRIFDKTTLVNTENLTSGIYTYTIHRKGKLIDNGKWIKK